MRFTSIITLSVAAASVSASPFKFPLPDGFPTPNATALAEIEKEAGGSLPNGALPTSLKSTGVTTLQLLALNEIFEVAFFTELLSNITDNVAGYDAASIAPLDKQYVLDAITTIVNVSRNIAHSLIADRYLARTITCCGCQRNSSKCEPDCDHALPISVSGYNF